MEGDIREGEVLIDSGNSYNGYLESVHMAFTMTGDDGEITYLQDSDEFLFTSYDGDSQIIRFENGNLIMEDGTVYNGTGTAMKMVNEQITALMEDADYDRASELMYMIVELTSSGFMGMDSTAIEAMVPLAANVNSDQGYQLLKVVMEVVASQSVDLDESVFNLMNAFAQRAEVLIENGESEGMDLFVNTFTYTMDMCRMGNAINGQAVYQTIENYVNIAERLVDNGYDAAYELLMMSMEFAPMAEAGIFGEDPAMIEQFKALYDRSEEILNNW